FYDRRRGQSVCAQGRSRGSVRTRATACAAHQAVKRQALFSGRLRSERNAFERISGTLRRNREQWRQQPQQVPFKSFSAPKPIRFSASIRQKSQKSASISLARISLIASSLHPTAIHASLLVFTACSTPAALQARAISRFFPSIRASSIPPAPASQKIPT